MQRWLAEELNRNDYSLTGFWPLTSNYRDHSGFGTHCIGPLIGGASPLGISQMRTVMGRPGFSPFLPGGSFAYLVADGGTNFDYFNDVNSSYTISFWFQPNEYGNPTSNLLAWQYRPTNVGLAGWRITYFNNTNGTINWESQTVGGSNSIASVDLKGSNLYGTRRWYHAAFVLESKGGNWITEWYVDGYSDNNRVNTTPTPGPTGGVIYVGATINGSTVTGSASAMSCVRLYKRALNSSEILDLYRRESTLNMTNEDLDEGFTPHNKTGLTLFVGGSTNPMWLKNTTLYEGGLSPTNNNIPLYIQGMVPVNSGIPLYVGSKFELGFNLFMAGGDPDSTSEVNPLVIVGNTPGTSGVFTDMPLYMESAVFDSKLNLVMRGPDSDSTVRNMNLIINGQSYTQVGNASLFLRNTQSGVNNNVSLVITAPGETSGSLPFISNMNVMLARDPANAIPLLICSPGTGINGHPSMFITGAFIRESGVNLVVPATYATLVQDNDLYTHGF
jgi:hypothetical protein